MITSGPVPVSRQMYNSLKDGVADLARLQRDLCNRMASDVRKVLEASLPNPERKKDKKQEELSKVWGQA